jgi:methyl coenzyme M reductase beta subunit
MGHICEQEMNRTQSEEYKHSIVKYNEDIGEEVQKREQVVESDKLSVEKVTVGTQVSAFTPSLHPSTAHQWLINGSPTFTVLLSNIKIDERNN